MAFTASAAAAPDQPLKPDDLAGRVERLEAEIATLKKMLKRLKADLVSEEDAA